jgi:regulatory protein
MRAPPDVSLASLRQRALRLLARRDYTRAELERKLLALAGAEPREALAEGEGCDECERFAETPTDAVAALLDDLVARGYVADSRYAEHRVLARAARYGNARLGNELRQRGVDGEVVADALAAGGDEYERALHIWQRKYGRAPADAGERVKQIRHLAARGFSGETVRRVLRQSGESSADDSPADDDGARDSGEAC